MTGTVIKTTGLFSSVLIEDNTIFSCRIKGSLRLKDFKYTNPITVGDIVDFDIDNASEKLGIIFKIHKRKNFIARKAVSNNKDASVLAANISQALLVITINNPKTSLGFIDRFIISAEANHIETILVLNKIDLLNQNDIINSQNVKNIYSSLGYKFIKISSLTKFNFTLLNSILINKISLIAGHSGVGKSTIINTLCSKLNLKIGELSKYNKKGVHTTTFSQMYNLDKAKTFIIDSPGIKELGLVYIPKEVIKKFFKEFAILQNKCKFNNCMHTNEPGCEVLQAVNKGQIHKSRYQSYLSMLNYSTNN